MFDLADMDSYVNSLPVWFGLAGLADESDRSVRMAHRNSCWVNEHKLIRLLAVHNL